MQVLLKFITVLAYLGLAGGVFVSMDRIMNVQRVKNDPHKFEILQELEKHGRLNTVNGIPPIVFTICCVAWIVVESIYNR